MEYKSQKKKKDKFDRIGEMRQAFKPVQDTLDKIAKQKDPIQVIDKRTDIKELKDIEGKVEVKNQIKLPDIQKVKGTVKVDNQPDLGKAFKEFAKSIPEVPSSISVDNPDDFKQEFPSSFTIKNLPKIQKIEGDVSIPPITNPKDPEDYLNVRLTDGEHFYKAIDAFVDTVSSTKQTFPFVNETTGAPQQAVVGDDGILKSTLTVGDIEIGAVELKDGDSDTRADIESDGSKNALFVQANDLDVNVGNQLVPEEHDYIGLSYTGDNLTTVTYKTGGSGGSTVATLTLAYTGSQLDSVTKA